MIDFLFSGVRCFCKKGRFSKMGRKGVTVMSRKLVRTMITALVMASLLVLTACGKAEQAADTASLDDGAVTRLEADEGEEHYIDDNAIALAGKASTSAGVMEQGWKQHNRFHPFFVFQPDFRSFCSCLIGFGTVGLFIASFS